MKKTSTPRLLRKIQSAWPNFRYTLECDQVKGDLCADWYDELREFEDSAVFQALDQFTRDENQKFAPSVAEFVRRLTGEFRAKENTVRATPGERLQFRKDMRSRDMVFARYQPRNEEERKHWHPKKDCISDGKNFWPKIEFAMHWLGGERVTGEIRKRFGGDVLKAWAMFHKDPEKLADYESLKDILCTAAMQVRKDSSSRFLEAR